MIGQAGIALVEGVSFDKDKWEQDQLRRIRCPFPSHTVCLWFVLLRSLSSHSVPPLRAFFLSLLFLCCFFADCSEWMFVRLLSGPCRVVGRSGW